MVLALAALVLGRADVFVRVGGSISIAELAVGGRRGLLQLVLGALVGDGVLVLRPRVAVLLARASLRAGARTS